MHNSPIGILDSGMGGIYTLDRIRELLPQYDYLYRGDTAYVPYGTKSPEVIRERTFVGLQRLFDQGAPLVIIACNTAAAYSIRDRQQQYPEHKALSVTVPIIQHVITQPYRHIGVLATDATVRSGVYPDLYRRLGGASDTVFSCHTAQDLVMMIEQHESDEQKIRLTISQYLHQFTSLPECLILGCTHFPVYMKYFRELYPGDVLDPSAYAAQSLASYLQLHPDRQQSLSTGASVQYHTTL